MSIFLYILGNNILPVFIMVGLGFLLSKRFSLNLFTLSKFNFYLFIPCFIFFNLYTASLSVTLLKILFFGLAYMIANDLLARVIAKIRKYDIGMTSAFKNSIMFNNAGNIGISLITLIFSHAPYVIDGETPYLNQALTAQVIILTFMNITMNTIGFYNAGKAKKDWKESVDQILTMPSIYAILLAIVLKYFMVDITATPLWPTLEYIKDGLVPMALFTLGVQLSQTEFDFRNIDVNIAVFTRLIIGPLLALAGIKLFGFSGVVAQTIFISYSVPTAVNTALIAIECNNYENFSSQQVMVSTIFGAITLTSAIYMAGILFPI
ncbi:Auxin Efflux Carrier [Syntrophobotulus glycolicus DSM 8271]|uniref:Auxin Efflux Carrier n=1 Tax=Syntrophobotulus glycolicus (strain DSM 8271 / FlGlyR) TaxID=645991 RepID=F0T2R3_SYNGF|nr:AEC family transporter [Syntrophobotulus glycolicus]ADY56462.1 Auxin Efflux Carrier [Syntrophobotulus glycolicus DSM 8271]